ncbi:pimeloyl-ACP methyl ester carboxylesterase [Paraburkholderia sp. JPY465]
MNVRNLPAHPVQYKTRQVGDVEVFYREAGPADAPVILLLHGFPTSSHMFRDLMPLLADRYRLVAPDLPGFGQTKAPPRGEFDYTFDNLAKVIDAFTEMLQLSRYAIYAFDDGAPTGYRLAVAHPERVTAIISQNGNAYVDAIFHRRKSICWMPDTLRSKRTARKSPRISTNFFRASCRIVVRDRR